MAKQIVPSDFKTHLIDQLIESVNEPSNTVYYAFIGNHSETGVQADDVVAPTEKLQDINVETYRNMIFGKRLTADDFSIMVPRYDWTSGTVYDQYDDTDANLLSKDFYVAVDETAFIHVYKCLYNANGAPSTAQPTFGDVATESSLFANDDNYYQTSDGYQWKYMYSVDSTTFDKFATQNFMPVVANNVVEQNALNGAIDVILVDTHGRFYNNTISSNFSESSTTGNPVIFRLPDGSSDVENFYSNTIIHLTSGTGAGQFKRVIASTANNLGQYIQTESAFAIVPDNTTNYELSPEVRIVSDGTQTVNCVARAIVNSAASNSIHRIEILQQGSNYNFANATILKGVPADADNSDSGTIIEVEDATVRPVIPPPGGHGANSAIELGGRILGIHAKFSNTENDVVIADNTFSQFGIIRDPVFANVDIKFVKQSDGLGGSDGEFVVNENVKQFTKKRLFGTFSTTSGNTIIESADDLDLENELSAGDYLYLTDSEVSTYNHFSIVNNVINSTSIELNDSVAWTGSNTIVYFATPTANAVVNQLVSSNNITLRECDNTLVTDRLIVGETSHAVANVQTINVNNRLASNGIYDFLAYNQMTKITGTITDTIQPNEYLTQANSGARALVHSVDGNEVFVTQVTGEFNTGESILANTSGATISSGFDKYSGELDPTSGNIIYLQNDIPVERANNSSEEIRIILEF